MLGFGFDEHAGEFFQRDVISRERDEVFVERQALKFKIQTFLKEFVNAVAIAFFHSS